MAWTKGQWPDNIVSGDICYDRVPPNCGMGEWYCLRDASHGIPVFGSVRSATTDSPALQEQEVHVFNYPKQTEMIAAELVKRWNAYPTLLAALKGLLPEGWADDDTMDHMPGVAMARAAMAKAGG